MSLFQEQRLKTGETILMISIELFRKNGYEATTIDEITKAVGIAKGTFYNFFGSKRDVLMKWAVQVFQKLDFRQSMISDRNFQQNMEAMLVLLEKYIIAEEGLFICFLKELVKNQGSAEEKEQFDFGSIISKIAENSADHNKITQHEKELKMDVLNDSLYMGMLRWFNKGNTAEGLQLYLKRIVELYLYGIIDNKEDKK